MTVFSVRNLLLLCSCLTIADGADLLSAIFGAVSPTLDTVTALIKNIPVIGNLLTGGCASGVKLARFLTFFRGIDNNSNNVFELSDYRNTAGRLLSVANYSANTPDDFYHPITGMVDQAFLVFPITPMPMHVYLLLATVVSSLQLVLKDRVNKLGAIMYRAFDYKDQGDGMIDKEECCGMWFTFSNQTDCSPAVLDPCFAELDRNNDGGIDQKEFTINALDYFNSSDPQCRCRCLLGPKQAEIPHDFLSQLLAGIQIGPI